MPGKPPVVHYGPKESDRDSAFFDPSTNYIEKFSKNADTSDVPVDNTELNDLLKSFGLVYRLLVQNETKGPVKPAKRRCIL